MSQADRAVLLWLNGAAGRVAPLDGLVEWLVSDYLITAFLGLSLVFIWFGVRDDSARMARQIGVLTALASVGLANAAVLTINSYYFRARPFEDLDVTLLFYRPTDSSMPSNSAATFIGLAAAVWWFDRRAGAVLLSAAGLHAFLRVYAGAHYPSDIAAGALIGVAAAFMAYRLRDLLEPILRMVIRAARVLCLA